MVIGVGSMSDAGVIAAFGPTGFAGGGCLLFGLALAAVVALANAIAADVHNREHGPFVPGTTHRRTDTPRVSPALPRRQRKRADCTPMMIRSPGLDLRM